jgi:hypothetical protein
MHNNNITSISWQGSNDFNHQQHLHLQFLNLAHCHVQPEHVLQMLQATAPSLQRLDLSHITPSCTDGDENPLWGLLAGATSLQVLNLAQAPGSSSDGSRALTRPPPLLAWQLAALRPSLRSLSLAGCGLAPPALSGLAELKSLQELDLTACGLTDAHLGPLAALTALTGLMLDNNPDISLEVREPLAESESASASGGGGAGSQRQEELGGAAWPDVWQPDGRPPEGDVQAPPPQAAHGNESPSWALPHLAYLSCRRTGVTDAGLQLLLRGSAGAAAGASPGTSGHSPPLQSILLGSPAVSDEGLSALVQLAPGLRAVTLQVNGCCRSGDCSL